MYPAVITLAHILINKIWHMYMYRAILNYVPIYHAHYTFILVFTALRGVFAFW